jgi:hypothetical protein
MIDDNQNYMYVVGERGMDKESVLHICRTYEKAYKKWNEIRKALLEFFEALYEVNPLEKFKTSIEQLQCTDPEELTNFPHVEPFIDKREII